MKIGTGNQTHPAQLREWVHTPNSHGFPFHAPPLRDDLPYVGVCASRRRMSISTEAVITHGDHHTMCHELIEHFFLLFSCIEMYRCSDGEITTAFYNMPLHMKKFGSKVPIQVKKSQLVPSHRIDGIATL